MGNFSLKLNQSAMLKIEALKYIFELMATVKHKNALPGQCSKSVK